MTLGLLRHRLAVKVLALNVKDSETAAGSNPGIHASHPAPCLCVWKAVGDNPKPWDHGAPWQIRKNLQDVGFWLAQLQTLWLLGE